MKKFLIGALIVVLIIMAYFAIFKGISIGSFQILSVEQIANENDKLTGEIKQTEVLMSTNYPAQNAELDKSISALLTARDEYLDLASVSTESEIKRANQQEEYTVEFLLTSLGRHARAQGVNLNYTLSAGTTGEADIKNITFTISGQYIPIIEFVSAIEDDTKLGFRIYNFKIVPGGDYLQATFLVMNVRVKQEKVSNNTDNQTNTQNSGTTSGNNANSTNNTNTTDTTTQNTQTNNTTSDTTNTTNQNSTTDTTNTTNQISTGSEEVDNIISSNSNDEKVYTAP